MKIGVIGLGLIGGSLAKAIKTHTDHTVAGFDKETSVVLRAKLVDAIDEDLDTLQGCDMLILALYPHHTIAFLEERGHEIPPGTLVIDCCGVKEKVCEAGNALAREHGFTYIGGHPMAGIERSGFAFSTGKLFEGASMILTPNSDIDIEALTEAKKFFLSLGFGSIKISTPEEHDQMIAYTSQLAHVLSSAYVRTPKALNHEGFSAGSFRDMIRVATLNEEMWTELFFQNRENLIEDIDGLIARLGEYSKALKEQDRESLTAILKDGCRQKALLEQYER
ncbi:MAG: prephenate dehydrogenase/arogenate dehydrogenase family protein [Clostridiales bacterium]|nr:prephenate dehydrogenase/arogenate dehydrogenase family protein [Clostridiales bacterium]